MPPKAKHTLVTNSTTGDQNGTTLRKVYPQNVKAINQIEQCFNALTYKFTTPDAKYTIPNVKYTIPNTKHTVPNIKSAIPTSRTLVISLGAWYFLNIWGLHSSFCPEAAIQMMPTWPLKRFKEA